MGDHAECIEIDFDPDEISFSDLLDKFFEWHNAFRKPYARQYMSAILFHDDQQKEAVDEAIRVREDEKRKIRTELQPYAGMTLAEDYHQKYYLRRNKTVALELKGRFPSLQEFVDAPAVAKANAILGGFLEPTPEALEELGFSKESQQQLLNRRKSFFGSLIRSVLPTP
jgi:peptide-methionine (S)-S-oxide reductase